MKELIIKTGHTDNGQQAVKTESLVESDVMNNSVMKKSTRFVKTGNVRKEMNCDQQPIKQ